MGVCVHGPGFLRYTYRMDEVFLAIGKQKVRFGAESMEEDIDNFFDTVIQERVIPVLQSSADKATPGLLLGEQFWNEVFSGIAEMVNDMSAAERKLILRALVGVGTYRRFQQLLRNEE